MARIAVGGQKGGSGKTTTLINLAVCYAMQGKRVAVMDQDSDQGSLRDWYVARMDTPYIVKHPIELVLKKLHPTELDDSRFDVTLIDLQGRDSLNNRRWIKEADIWIVPFKPSSMDVKTLPRIRTMAEAVLAENPELLFQVFLNEAPIHGAATEIRWARDKIDNMGLTCAETVIHSRKAYRTCIDGGRGVAEHPRTKDEKKAADECWSLFNELMAEYNGLLNRTESSNSILKHTEDYIYGS